MGVTGSSGLCVDLSGTMKVERVGWAAGMETTEEERSISHITPWKSARVLMSEPEELLSFRGTSRNRSEPWEEAKQ